MFYEQQLDKALRFGDIVQGFPALAPVVERPPLSAERCNYSIDVDIPRFTVILTPCCRIRENVISICPLRQIDSNLLKNPYLKEDLGRLNLPMPAEKAIPPQRWDKMGEEEKRNHTMQGQIYVFRSYFIYTPHDILPPYILNISSKNEEMRHYMIDFRDSLKIRCKEIVAPDKAPLSVKCLQLSIATRKELREKIADYFGKEPEEDRGLS